MAFYITYLQLTKIILLLPLWLDAFYYISYLIALGMAPVLCWIDVATVSILSFFLILEKNIIFSPLSMMLVSYGLFIYKVYYVDLNSFYVANLVVLEYKINKQKSMAFLYTKNRLSDNEINFKNSHNSIKKNKIPRISNCQVRDSSKCGALCNCTDYIFMKLPYPWTIETHEIWNTKIVKYRL